MAIAHVQDVLSTANSNAVTVSISSTTGHTLIATGRFYSPSGPSHGYPSAITDSAGNTWVLSTAQASTPPTVDFPDSGIFVAYCIGAAAVTHVTITGAASGITYTEINVSEWSGIGSAGTGGIVTLTTAEMVSPSLSVSAGDLMLGIVYPQAGTSPLGTLPTGTTALANGGDNVNWAVWQLPSAGTVHWDWSTSGSFISAAMTFHPSTVFVVQQKNFPAAWSGSLTSAVTAGSTLFLVASGFTSTAGQVISTSAPLLGGSPVTGSVKIQEVQSGSTGATVYHAVWMLPNCPGGSAAVALTMSGSATISAVGLAVYEVSGLGATPHLDRTAKNCTTVNVPNGTSIDSLATTPVEFAGEFILGVGVNDQGSGSGSAGWTSSALASNSWTGYQLPAGSGGTFEWTQTATANANWSAGVVCIASQAPTTGLIQQVFSDVGSAVGGTDSNTNTNSIMTGAGHTLVAVIGAYSHTGSAFAITSISDSAGNTWTFSTSTSSQNPPAASGVFGYSALAAIAYSTSAQPVTSITVVVGNTCFDFRLTVYEWAQSSPSITGAASNIPNSAAATYTTPSVAASAGGGGVAVCASDAGYLAASAPWRIQTGPSDLVTAWLDGASAGSTACTFSVIAPPDSGTQQTVSGAILTFSAGAQPPAPVPPERPLVVCSAVSRASNW